MSSKTLLFIFLFVLPLGCSVLKKRDASVTQSNAISIDQPVIKNLDEVDARSKKLQHSLARIHLRQGANTLAIGTGFFYKSKDIFVTSYHVIEGKPECLTTGACTVFLGFVKNSKEVREIETRISVIFKSEAKDLIVLKIQDASQFSQVLPLQIKAKRKEGRLMTAGFYHDDPALTFSEGQLLKAQSKHAKALSSIIVSAGFSGSPVINRQGELVGVVSSYKPIQGQQTVGLAEYIAADDLNVF
ncbi:MAG: serine protease [Bdellovibrionales bacterium]|nr:serine protease [Bdellovibrionales bacterium]